MKTISKNLNTKQMEGALLSAVQSFNALVEAEEDKLTASDSLTYTNNFDTIRAVEINQEAWEADLSVELLWNIETNS